MAKDNDNKRQNQNPWAADQGSPQKQWDERPGKRDSDPSDQQRQRKWEEAQKSQQEYAKRPGIGENDLKQHDAQGNPTDRDENFFAEE